MDKTIALAMVEDDPSFLEAVGAAAAATSDVRMLATAATLGAGLALLDGPPAQVLLTDLGLPDGSGIEMIRAARARWPQCEVVVATMFGEEEKVLAAIEAGASGYLLKDALPASLMDEIRSVHAGGSPVSPMIARQLLRRLRPRLQADAVESDLSAREVQVLERLALGYTMPEVAQFLDVSVTTVQTYARRIYRKLGVHSKIEAVDAAYRRGLLQRQ